MIYIKLLGQFAILADDRPVRLPYKPAQSLLAYLLLQTEAQVGREELASLYWPDADSNKARNNLRQTLWRLRQALGAELLQADRSSVGIAPQIPITLDVSRLIELPGADLSTEALLAACEAYTGELLPGFYEEWILQKRQQLWALFNQLMNSLLERLLHEGRWPEAINQAERWLSFGEPQETAFRALITARAASGDRGGAAAAYERCVAALQDELNVAPSEATVALYDQLVVAATAAKSAAAEQLPPFLKRRPREQTGAAELCVQREPQLAQLRQWLQASMTDGVQIALISGEAGQGKSCLLRTFCRQALAASDDLIVAWGSCPVNTGARDSFLPFRDLLVMLTGGAESGWRAGQITTEAARRLWSLLPDSCAALADHGLDLLDTFVPGIPLRRRWRAFGLTDEPWLARLERRIERNSLYGLRPDAAEAQIAGQYTALLKALAVGRPLLLIVDDLHWADRGSLSLLAYLCRRLGGARVMLAAAYRPEHIGRSQNPFVEVISEIKRRFGAVTIDLDQANPDARTFIDALIDSQKNRLGDSFRQQLTAYTEGHPLFTIELLRELQARGDLRKDMGGYWVAGSDLELDYVLARVDGVIEQRLGHLDHELRGALRVASVMGEQFEAEIVAAALGEAPAPLVARLSRELVRRHRLLVTQESSWQGQGRHTIFRFRHHLYQDYLYRGLDEAEQRIWHERIADSLAATYEGVADRSLAIQLAHHFAAAGRWQEASDNLLQAGRQAMELAAFADAAAHFEEALRRLTFTSPGQNRDHRELLLQVWLSHAYALLYGRTGSECEPVYARISFLLTEQSEPVPRQLALWALWNYHLSAADHRQALELAEAFVAGAATADPITRQNAYFALAYSQMSTGRIERSLHSCAVGLAQGEERDQGPAQGHYNVAGEVLIQCTRAIDLWLLGYPDQALQVSEAARQQALALNHPPTLSSAHIYCRMIHLFRREWTAFGRLIDDEIALARRYEMASGLHGAGFHGALAIYKRGRPAEGIRLMQAALAENKRRRLLVGHAWDLHYLALACAEQGDLAAAEAALAEGLAFSETQAERFFLAELLRARGELALLRGAAAAEIKGHFEAALAVAREQAARGLELRGALSLARLYADEGRPAAAVDLLGPVYTAFTEGFNTVDLREAAGLLAALA